MKKDPRQYHPLWLLNFHLYKTDCVQIIVLPIKNTNIVKINSAVILSKKYKILH